MAIGDIIVGIDIGSSKVSLVMGEVNNFNQIEVICSTSEKCKGIKKSIIIDEDEIALAISKVIQNAEEEANLKINSAYVTIPGKYVTIVQNSITKDVKDKYAGISTKDVASSIIQVKDIDVPEGKNIIDIVADHFGISIADLKSNKKTADISIPRQICMYLIRTMTNTALKGIGIVLGGKDHSTIKYGSEKIAKQILTDETLANTVNIIKKKINPA